MIAEGMTYHDVPRAQLEQAIIEWRATRAMRLEKKKEIEKLEAREKELYNFAREVMVAQEIEGVLVDDRLTRPVERHTPIVEDRDALEKYIYENRMLDLLTFRLSGPAVKERLEAGLEIPGVGDMVTYDLSDTKAK